MLFRAEISALNEQAPDGAIRIPVLIRVAHADHAALIQLYAAGTLHL